MLRHGSRMNQTHNQQKRVEDVFTALMVLSKLQAGQKLGTRLDIVHAESGNSYWSALVRHFNEESRTKTHTTLKAVYEDAYVILKEGCDKYNKATTRQDKIKQLNFIRGLADALRSSKSGLSNLMFQYKDDTAVQSRFELMMSEIDTELDVAIVTVPDLQSDDDFEEEESA